MSSTPNSAGNQNGGRGCGGGGSRARKRRNRKKNSPNNSPEPKSLQAQTLLVPGAGEGAAEKKDETLQTQQRLLTEKATKEEAHKARLEAEQNDTAAAAKAKTEAEVTEAAAAEEIGFTRSIADPCIWKRIKGNTEWI